MSQPPTAHELAVEEQERTRQRQLLHVQAFLTMTSYVYDDAMKRKHSQEAQNKDNSSSAGVPSSDT